MTNHPDFVIYTFDSLTGSGSGSFRPTLVCLLKKQLPITTAHLDSTRYFMKIPQPFQVSGWLVRRHTQAPSLSSSYVSLLKYRTKPGELINYLENIRAAFTEAR